MAAAASLAAMVLAGVIIYVQTDKGELKIEVTDQNIEAKINEKGVTIRDVKSGQEHVLKLGRNDVRTGEYEIISELPDGAEIVHGNKFEIRRGRETLVTVRALPKGQRQPNQPAEITAATEAAGNWLALVDEGEYAQSWDQSSEHNRKAIGKNDYVQIYQQLYASHGRLTSRRFLTVEPHLSSSGSEYVVIKYRTNFAYVKDITEEVISSHDSDGQWRVSGYWRRGGGVELTKVDKAKVA
ncbi:MAG TPA: DUF4019 domain-containing protein, partial [Gemmataceae bacterium]|nr:DUF4019 domain-containing protein [Gemmataceae bacterium]